MINRILAAAGLAGILAGPAIAADLEVEVHGIRSGDGRLFVAVHSPETRETFPASTGMVAALQLNAHYGTIRFVLRDLPPGRYAVAAFHDENGNGDLDTNLLGIPSEGVGFANDAPSNFGPPDFESAALTLGDAPAAAAMTLRYPMSPSYSEQGGS